MKEKRKYAVFAVILFFLYLLFLVDLENMIRKRSAASFLSDGYLESVQFRQQKISRKDFEEIRRAGTENWIDLVLVSISQGGFCPEKTMDIPSVLNQYKPEKFQALRRAYRAIWEDVKYFPVAAEKTYFENTWLAERNFGAQRVHEGTDIFGKENRSGYYPVISMTDGVVEKKGWLPLGGNRIGIRAAHGGYFYYAHLSSYAKEFQTGEQVNAGDILGYMGNTGYGPEGTKGRFPVHLHLGIYIPVTDQKEISINPFYLLKIFQKNIRKYTY